MSVTGGNPWYEHVARAIFSLLLDYVQEWLDRRYGPGAVTQLDNYLFRVINSKDESQEGV